jgi:serine/threonine protein kinase/Tfp pilus assembly protein PilF
MAVRCPKCQTENTSDSQFCKTCAEPLPGLNDVSSSLTKTIEAPKEELTTGSVFAGRYQIIEELGRGGMGRVYRVLDKKLNEEVALKLIKPEISLDKKTVQRFSNELKIARKVVHKNVARMFDLNEEKGAHYITMEYVRGEDLKKLIRKIGRLSPAQVLPIARQVCEGLSEAHREGIVHRDLKPQNIMVNEEGDARIMDFGIARSVERKGITGAGVMIGTPEYMSPEQVEGKDVDQRSDIYSLGVILYEMVTGQVPFEGDTIFAVGVKHKSEEPQNPKEINPQIPEDLSRVILRCLEKNRENRYQSAGELRSELTSIEKGIPTTERKPPVKKPMTSKEITVTITAKKLLIPGAVVVACVILAVVLWQVFSKGRAAPPPTIGKPSLAIMYFKNNTGDDGLDHWRTMLSNLLIADLTQSKHLRVLSEDKLFNILTRLNQTGAKTYSSAILEQVASEGGVNHILQGAYAKAGDEFRINVTLQEAGTGELIGSESVAGKGEESIFSMVDELTRRVKANFKLSQEEIAGDIDKDVGMVTTSSPEAYRYYVEGIRYDVKGDYPKVIEYMEKAVAVDPEFASAYNAMSWSYGNQYYFAEERKYAEKALELSHRLTDREKYYIQGNYYLNSEQTYDKAQEALEKLIELYPDDIGGNNSLGNLYSRIGEEDKAIERYRVCIENKTDDVVIYRNLAGQYRKKGMFEESTRVLESYLENISDSALIHQDIAFNYCLLRKFDLALAEMEKAFSLSPSSWQNFREKGDVYYHMDDFQKAEQDYRELLKRGEPVARVSGLWRLRCLYLLQARFRELKEMIEAGLEHAEKSGQKEWKIGWLRTLFSMNMKKGHPELAFQEAEKAWDIAVEVDNAFQQRRALRNMGLAYLGMGTFDKALNTAQRLKKMSEQALNKNVMSEYDYLMGMIELEKKNYSKAIEYFKRGQLLLHPVQGDHLIFADSLGRAYQKAGDLDSAIEEYERAGTLIPSRLFAGDIYAQSFYRLGTIYEQKGMKEKAEEKYEKFLDLWKNADSGLPEVEDAQKRLAALRETP